MRVTREQAAANRERVIDVASRLFRENGVDGIGLNDLMQAAGLTRGGFYGQFVDKRDLIEQATARALDDNLAQWSRWLGQREGGGALKALVRAYLSTTHVADRGQGCALAGLAADAARGEPGMQQAMAGAVERFVALVSTLPAGVGDARADRAEGEAESEALATLATLVGALVLSRAVGDGRLGKRLRRAAGDAILQRVSGPAGKSG